MIKELKAKFNTTLVLISHDLGVVAQVCKKVAIMYAGRLVEYGPIVEVFRNPLHPYTEGLFNSIPTLESEKKRLTPIPGLMPDPSQLPPGCSFAPRCPYAQEACAKRAPEPSVVGSRHVECLMYEGHAANLMRKNNG
jgi:peptide/nickel transport system ATP-binding protein